MRKKHFALATLFALLLNFASFAGGDTTRTKAAKKRASMRLVGMLPASDGIAIFDARQFFGTSLPTILASNQPALSEITVRINEMANRTGVDLRKFDEVAVGIATKQVSANETDFEPVAIARGDVADGALNAIKKLAANGSYREENIADKTVFVFTAGPSLQNTSSSTSGSKITGVMDKALRGLQHEIAVTALSNNTLVLGTLSRVRETLEARTHVGADVTALLAVKELSVFNFAFKTAGNMSRLLPLDVDMIGKSLDKIQYISGSLDVASTGTTFQTTARTRLPHEAAQLKDTLDVFKSMGSMLLSNSKKPNQAVYGRMLNGARVTLKGSDVSLDLTVAQADIDALVTGIK